MTLVVADRRSDQLTLWADSALSNDLDPRRDFAAMCLKPIVLHRGLCVAFAGGAEDGTSAILNLGVDPHTGFNVDNVVRQLHVAHRDSGGRTDFLIGSIIPTPSLMRISGGEILMPDQTFIGEPAAYSAYRSDLESRNCEELSEQMLKALESVIHDESVPKVGGVAIGVVTRPAGFEYQAGWSTLASTASVEIGPWTTPNVHHLLPIPRTAAEGGYRNVFAVPAKAGVAAFAVYFQPGDLGFLLNPRVDLYPIPIANVTQDEFEKSILDRYGIELIFLGRLHPDW